MDTEYMKELAYTAIDRLLFGLQNDTIKCYAGMDPAIPHRLWYYYFKQVVDKYHLVGYKHWDTSNVTGILYLAEEGMKAIEIGGIREYMLTYDKAFRNWNGYPKLCIGSIGGNTKNKMFVYNDVTEKDARIFFSDPGDTVIFFNPPDQEAEKSSGIQPVPQTVINNHIAGSVGNLQNNSGSIGATNQVNEGNIIGGKVGMRNPNSEGPWTKWGVIIAIIVCIITAVGVYYAWLGLHLGK